MFRTTSAVILLVAVFILGAAQRTMAADATISGKVTHAADGTPVDTLIVYAENYTTGELDSDYTDSNGDYSITIDDDNGGTAGQYLVYNYTATTTELNVVFYRASNTVTLTDGENKTAVNLSLTRRGRLAGYAYASDGTTPIYYAYVYLSRDTTWYDGYGADYATAGGYYVVSPAPYPDATKSGLGMYTATVTASGYFGAEVEDLFISADETTSTQNFTLTAASTVSGTVTDRDGNPISGATVLLDEIDSYYSYSARTNSSGVYTINVVDLYDYNGTAVGQYSLQASADGYVTRSQTVIIEEDESSLNDYDFSLREAGRISGQVVTVGSELAIEDATITASDGYGHTYTETTDTTGAYSFTDLRPSSQYSVTISADGYVTETIYDVVVKEEEETTITTVRLIEAVTFSGQVVTRAGSDAVAGATIQLFNRAKPRSGSADYKTTAETDGRFSFTGVAPGRFRVQVSANGYVTLTRNLLDLTESVSSRTYRLQQAATLTGRLTVDNDPISQALVTAYSKNPSTTGYGSDYTDSDGYYSIATLKPGRYTIRITSTGYVEKVLRRRLKRGEVNEINIGLKEAGSVEGYVVDAENGLPLSGYQVRVRHRSNSAYTDSNGYYIIDGLPAGSYKLYIYSTAYKTGRSSRVEVKANRVTKYVNFSLARK